MEAKLLRHLHVTGCCNACYSHNAVAFLNACEISGIVRKNGIYDTRDPFGHQHIMLLLIILIRACFLPFGFIEIILEREIALSQIFRERQLEGILSAQHHDVAFTFDDHSLYGIA